MKKAELKSKKIESEKFEQIESKISFIFEPRKADQREKELTFFLEISFGKKKRQFESGNFLFALNPENEILAFSKKLYNFLLKAKDSFYFQPIEASFELKIESLSTDSDQFKIFFWIDLGQLFLNYNAWDSLGVRFVTCRSKIASFARELEEIWL